MGWRDPQAQGQPPHIPRDRGLESMRSSALDKRAAQFRPDRLWRQKRKPVSGARSEPAESGGVAMREHELKRMRNLGKPFGVKTGNRAIRNQKRDLRSRLKRRPKSGERPDLKPGF